MLSEKFQGERAFKEDLMSDVGLKLDSEKIDWSVLPLEILEPLVEVFAAGEKKYGHLNWQKEFKNGDRRFHAATMRHIKDAQYDPLAKDLGDTECFHLAQASWNLLIRLHKAIENEKEKNLLPYPDPDS
jgi:hypothetical protein